MSRLIELVCNLLENFAKLPKVLYEKFERAKSCHFRGCKFCETIYSNFSLRRRDNDDMDEDKEDSSGYYYKREPVVNEDTLREMRRKYDEDAKRYQIIARDLKF